MKLLMALIVVLLSCSPCRSEDLRGYLNDALDPFEINNPNVLTDQEEEIGAFTGSVDLVTMATVTLDPYQEGFEAGRKKGIEDATREILDIIDTDDMKALIISLIRDRKQRKKTDTDCVAQLAEQRRPVAVKQTTRGEVTMNNTKVCMEMPRYRCHKEVWALKIAAVNRGTDGSAVITPEDARYVPFRVSAVWMTLNPKVAVGGYFVQYQRQPGETESYTAYSPADAFEDGYTLM